MAAVSEVAVTVMRGGTSKGVFMSLRDLPDDAARRDAFVLRLMGSPDPMQIDGLGGTHSSTSKVVAVEAWRRDGAVEIAYLFAQVGVERAVVDWRGNCGNLTAAVGPYALYEGLLEGHDPVTEVALVNLNTDRRVTARVPTIRGRPRTSGDLSIAGVPGTGAPISLEWHDPGGSVTGDVLPTGAAREEVATSWGVANVSVVDVAGPFVFVDAADLGLTGSESSLQLNQDVELVTRMIELRARVCERLGLAPPGRADEVSPAIPRVALVGAPADYVVVGGQPVAAGEYDVSARALSMGRFHHALPGTALLCLAAACRIEGTIPHRVATGSTGPTRIGHNKGVAGAEATVEPGPGGWRVPSVTTVRTARRLLRGVATVDLD